MRHARGAAVVAVALVAALSVAGACSDGRGSQPGATVPPGGDEPSTAAPATTLGAEAYAVPAVIDEAYIQKVVSAYDKVLGDAIRILKRDEGVSEEFLEHLVGIYTAQEFEFQQQIWLESVAEDRVAKTPEDPGPPITDVVRLERADQRCVIVRINRDYRPTLKQGQPIVAPDNDHYAVLVRAKEGRNPRQLNPTPWVMAFDGSKNDNSVPVNSCDD